MTEMTEKELLVVLLDIIAKLQPLNEQERSRVIETIRTYFGRSDIREYLANSNATDRDFCYTPPLRAGIA